jgi:hypothetical protein
MRGFKKCCISSIMDGTDDYAFWNDSKDNGNDSNECEENEGSDCEDGESTDDEVGEIDSDW